MNRILLRQLFICSGPWTQYFVIGISMGFQTVLVPQLRKQNQKITTEQFSWLPALQIYSAIPWIIILTALVNIIGRKKPYIIVCICSIITYIAFYFCNNITHFLIAQIFYGALSSSYLTSSLVILAEYTSSKYRGMFLTFKTATTFWGVLVANAMGTFFHWRRIVLLGLICSVYTLLNVMFWPESPLWLANKNRFVECAAAHRWLKGNNEEAEKELDKLLKSHENKHFVKQPCSVSHWYRTICCKQFCKPILLAIGLICVHSFSGKAVCTIFSLDILKKITSSESTAYSGMLILDAVSVASMYLGSVLSKFFKRRAMLLGFSMLSILSMIVIAIYLYLAKLSFVYENKYISLFLLSSYSVTTSCGPLILTTSIIGELIPFESRALSLCIIALCYKLIFGTTFKLTPFYFKSFEIHGTFAFFAAACSIFLTLIYFYLPETKDKTLQEIDACLKGNVESVIEETEELMNGVRRRT